MREEKAMARLEGARPDAAFPGSFPNGERGFSLVEVTLALLVVAVGMTAAFSLFPEAIRSTRASVSNTETALFADYVFSTLDLQAGYAPVEDGEGYTDINVNTLPEKSYGFRSDAFSRNAARKNFEIVRSNKAETFCWIPDNYGINGAEEMSHELQGKMKTATFTYQLTLMKKDALGGCPILAVLKVWPGEYEDLNPKSKEAKDTARVFYREILPPK